MIQSEENARYDRQIRLWGAEAQAKMSQAHILVIGLRGLHIEAVKNLVLAGISLTLVEHRIVVDYDVISNFFVSQQDKGDLILNGALPRLQNLNPFVKVNGDSRRIEELPDQFFSQFDAVFCGAEVTEVRTCLGFHSL